MRKILITVLTIILTIGMAMAQKTNDGGGTGGGNNNDGGGGGGGGGNETCLSSVTGIAGALAGKYHKNLLGKSNKIDLATSLEIMPVVGYSLPLYDGGLSYYNFLPRVRGNYGAFSADIMVDYWADTEDFSVNPYKAGHGLLMFNIIPSNMFRASIGQGVLYNMDSEDPKMYHESFLGIDGGIMNRSITASLEGRFAYDYETSTVMYLYIEGKGGYRLANAGPASIYVIGGLAYRDVATVMQDIVPFIGLNVLIH